MNSFVLDASAVLAVMHAERGHEEVVPHLHGGTMSAVNYSEVIKKAVEAGSDLARTKSYLGTFMLRIVPFDASQGSLAAEIWPSVKARGLSFADRACLALAIMEAATVLTADGQMAKASDIAKVRLIRERN